MGLVGRIGAVTFDVLYAILLPMALTNHTNLNNHTNLVAIYVNKNRIAPPNPQNHFLCSLRRIHLM